MLHSVHGNASNIGNRNTGIIAGGNVTNVVKNIVYSSQGPSLADIPQTTRSHVLLVHKKFLLWAPTERTRSPWDEWDLDKTFFRSLSRYIKDYPAGRLDRVLVQISTAIEASEGYLILIPGNPFPAESLFKALGCLLKLGMTVKRMKQDVFEFARLIVEWIQGVLSAYEDVEHNQFTFLTWRSLRNTRDLVNEICSMAQCRLKDHRWTQIQNGFRIGKEIDTFRVCLAESKEIFRDLSLLHLQGGMSAILAGIRSILFRQDQILNEIRKVKKQQRDQIEYLFEEVEEMKRAQVRKAFLEKNLDRRTVTDPDYVTQEKNPCDEGTRVAELAEIKEWLESISPGSQNFLWLTGDPGCGKSAITASLAAHCRTEGVLWAQFFVNRNNEETTNPNKFFPTIASQLAEFSPDVGRAIHDQLKVDPTLSVRMTSEQAAKLFIDALVVASRLDPGKVVAVIIDGLDETDKTRLYDTAGIFSSMFKSLIQYPNIKVFVSSRTEDHILAHFSQHGLEVNVKHVYLDTTASIGDVALFMRRQIQETIVNRFKLDWEEWPTEKGMELLAIRASGLFIWAVTAVRYLQAKIDEDGRECLGSVLRQLIGNVLEGINNLYTFILLSTQKKLSTDPEQEFEKFQRIIGAIIVLREPLCLDGLSRLLNLRYGPDNVPVDVVHFVRRLRTVLIAGTNAIDGKAVPRLHKSFFEFITDATLFKQLPLDHRYCVDPAAAEEQMAMCCIRLFSNSRKNNGRSLLREGSHLKYASQFCISHVDAVARQASISAMALVTLDTTVEDVHNRFSITRQTGRLTPWFSFDLNRSPAPFSPLTAAYQVTSERRILATVESNVLCLTYSPDGEKLVSGLHDGRLILWNLKKGTEIAEFKGHTYRVWSVAFSPLGDRIASSSYDKTVRIWNVATTQLVNVIHRHSGIVYSVAFSPVEPVVASASDDQSVRLWNVDSGESVGSPFVHDSWVNNVTFSKDGNVNFSGAGDGVYVWNRNTRECQQKLKSVIEDVHSVAISPFEDRLVAVGPSGLCFWNRTDLGFVLDDRLTLELGFGSIFFRAVFSSDGESVLVSDRSVLAYRSNVSFFLYNLSTRIKIPVHDHFVENFAISPNGSSIISSVDKNIHIFDVPKLLPVTFTFLSPDAEIVVCIFSDKSIWLETPKNLPAVSKKLDGDVGNVEHLTISSDNSLLAAVDENSIYIWDASSRKLCGNASYTSLGRITTLSFLADRHTLTSTHEDQSTYTWNVVDGTLHPRSINYTSSDIAFDTLLLLDIDPDRTRDIAGARWYPAKSKDSGLWAHVDNTLIRIRPDGNVTLLPLDSN